MASRHLQLVLHYLRHLSGPADNGGSTDSHLLERFITARDEAAFAILVQRHGRTVLGVCRRLLHNPDDVDDAFQATFLVLAGKAGSIHRRHSLSSWLYGVAYRVALRARARLSRRRDKEQPLHDYTDERQEEPSAAVHRRELCALVDEELSRLPDKYRAPLLLCDAAGMSWTMAARELCWTAGKLQRRLQRGREVLRVRLQNRGVVLPAAGVSAVLLEQTALALPPALAGATSKMALFVAAGEGVTSPAIGALAHDVMKTMWLGKLKIAAACLIVTMAAAGLGVGALAPAMPGQRRAQDVKRASAPGTSLAERTAPAAADSGADKDSDSGAAKQTGPDAQEMMSLAAHILDSGGESFPNADVAVVGLAYLSARRIGSPTILSQGKTDQQGRFRFSLPGDAKDRFWVVFLLARGSGHGLTRLEIPLEGKQTEVALRLGAPQALRGRLVDLQGAPASGVKLRVVAFPYRLAGKAFVRALTDPRKTLAMWPEPISTDSEGRFVVNGIGLVETVRIRIEDDRFARQEFDIKSGKDEGQDVTLAEAVPIDIPFGRDEADTRSRKKMGEVTLALEAARILEGQVTYADTGMRQPRPGFGRRRRTTAATRSREERIRSVPRIKRAASGSSCTRAAIAASPRFRMRASLTCRARKP
jgi:RNA polymerase sigma factor (sigma-70 family)